MFLASLASNAVGHPATTPIQTLSTLRTAKPQRRVRSIPTRRKNTWLKFPFHPLCEVPFKLALRQLQRGLHLNDMDGLTEEQRDMFNIRMSWRLGSRHIVDTFQGVQWRMVG